MRHSSASICLVHSPMGLKWALSLFFNKKVTEHAWLFYTAKRLKLRNTAASVDAVSRRWPRVRSTSKALSEVLAAIFGTREGQRAVMAGKFSPWLHFWAEGQANKRTFLTSITYMKLQVPQDSSANFSLSSASVDSGGGAVSVASR